MRCFVPVARKDLGDAFGPGYPLQSPLAGARSDFRFYPYRLRSLALPARSACHRLRRSQPCGRVLDRSASGNALSAPGREPGPRFAAGRTTSRPSAPARSRSPLPSSAAERLAPLGGREKRTPT